MEFKKKLKEEGNKGNRLRGAIKGMCVCGEAGEGQDWTTLKNKVKKKGGITTNSY